MCWSSLRIIRMVLWYPSCNTFTIMTRSLYLRIIMFSIGSLNSLENEFKIFKNLSQLGQFDKTKNFNWTSLRWIQIQGPVLNDLCNIHINNSIDPVSMPYHVTFPQCPFLIWRNARERTMATASASPFHSADDVLAALRTSICIWPGERCSCFFLINFHILRRNLNNGVGVKNWNYTNDSSRTVVVI